LKLNLHRYAKGSAVAQGRRMATGRPPKPQRCAPLSPAVAFITTAFRALDRERSASTVQEAFRWLISA